MNWGSKNCSLSQKLLLTPAFEIDKSSSRSARHPVYVNLSTCDTSVRTEGRGSVARKRCDTNIPYKKGGERTNRTAARYSEHRVHTHRVPLFMACANEDGKSWFVHAGDEERRTGEVPVRLGICRGGD